ncbi:hypothetical protein PhCBS80983_g01932 [Powellomyces hirtus]|uniref:Uncharacterized protein n=1 Tax=Powellomyces hirtus TaxID=109895 RepID=A0A507EAX4_9FUNG|nr:hypothetical protein PhCBS80983_g01932 [Powellomyces hirtus]
MPTRAVLRCTQHHIRSAFPPFAPVPSPLSAVSARSPTSRPLSQSTTPPPPTNNPPTIAPVCKSAPRLPPIPPLTTSASTPYTSLKIYVFPTLHNKHVFHPAFLRPRSPFERGAIIAAYILRKWRYQLSDTFAFAWHAFGASAATSGIMPAKMMYKWGNRATTRKAADEYFLKSVPRITEHVEFIYPASANAKLIKNQVGEILANSDRHRGKLFLWALLLPSALYISKFYLALANILFTYNVFRLNASWRSMYGSKVLQKLIDSRNVTWTPSEELDAQVKSISEDVTKRLSGEGAEGRRVWRWTRDGDLHDEVVEQLERDLKLAELGRTYRRARLQYFVHGPKEM